MSKGISKMETTSIQLELEKELLVRIGMVAKYVRIRKPEYCEICKRKFDNYEWHYKLSHTNFKEEMLGARRDIS